MIDQERLELLVAFAELLHNELEKEWHAQVKLGMEVRVTRAIQDLRYAAFTTDSIEKEPIMERNDCNVDPV